MKLRYILIGLGASLALASCDSPNGLEKPSGSMNPGKIEGIRSDSSTPGQIILHWTRTNATGEETLYTQVKYYDPYLGKEVVRFGSYLGDSVVIPKTWAAAGEYKFSLMPVSPTGNEGSVVDFSATAMPVPPELVATGEVKEQVQLTTAQLSSNAKEPSEGSFESLVNGTEDNDYFHSAWSVSVNAEHYLQVDLGQHKMEFIRIGFQTRKSGGQVTDAIKRLRLEKSKDQGETWESVGTDSYDKPASRGEIMEGRKAFHLGKEYTLIRIIPEARWNQDPINKGYFSLAELIINEVGYQVTDFEAEAKKVIDSHSTH